MHWATGQRGHDHNGIRSRLLVYDQSCRQVASLLFVQFSPVKMMLLGLLSWKKDVHKYAGKKVFFLELNPIISYSHQWQKYNL